MIKTIVALVSAPLWFAVTKKPAAKAKRGRQSSRPAVKRAAGRTRAKKPAAAEKELKAPPPIEEETAPPAEPPPPPPPPVAPVQAPALFSPGPGEPVDSLTPSFRWFYVGGASHYQLVWAPDTHFHKAHILLTTQTAATLPPEQALDSETTFFWRVRGGNEGGWGPWSVTRTFRTPGQF